MKNNFEKLPGSKVRLTIALTPQEFEVFFSGALEEAASRLQIKGFRPGAAPRELAASLTDKTKVFEEAVRKAAAQSVKETAAERGWLLIEPPKVEIKDAGTASGLKFEAELTVFPEVKLPNYKKIIRDVLKEKQPAEAEPAEVEKTINWLRESRASLARVNRGAATGDLIEADIKTKLDGEPIKNGEVKGDRFVLGESRFIPGFDDRLAGRIPGETFDFVLQAPPDYWQKDLRGRSVEFQVKIRAVFLRTLPELNDDFASRLGSNFRTIADLKASVLKGIKIEKEQKENNRLRDKILKTIAANSEIDFPAIMLERVLDSLEAETREFFQKNRAPLDLKSGELREKLKDQARERLINSLIIDKIVSYEKLEPTGAEIDKEALALGLDPKTRYDYAYNAARSKKFFEFAEKVGLD